MSRMYQNTSSTTARTASRSATFRHTARLRLFSCSRSCSCSYSGIPVLPSALSGTHGTADAGMKISGKLDPAPAAAPSVGA